MPMCTGEYSDFEYRSRAAQHKSYERYLLEVHHPSAILYQGNMVDVMLPFFSPYFVMNGK